MMEPFFCYGFSTDSRVPRQFIPASGMRKACPRALGGLLGLEKGGHRGNIMGKV